jgi:competence protein ComEA
MKGLKEFFEFSKKELNGLLVFCILLILIAFVPFFYALLNPPKAYNFSEFKKEVAAFRSSAVERPHFKAHYDDASEEAIISAVLHPFNPNGLSVAEWKKLGLRDYQIKTIKNYESKGGKFYRKEDLRKIYSIREEDFLRLEPYINIPARQSDFHNNDKSLPKTEKPRELLVDINTADSSGLEVLRGIGPAFASRIVKYRNRIGGFYRKEQLKEVYGLDSIKYRQIENNILVNPSAIKRIFINSVAFEDIKRHPYLTYKQMNAILKYRNQHGNYQNISDLKAISILSPEVIDKIAPYLSFETK